MHIINEHSSAPLYCQFNYLLLWNNACLYFKIGLLRQLKTGRELWFQVTPNYASNTTKQYSAGKLCPSPPKFAHKKWQYDPENKILSLFQIWLKVRHWAYSLRSGWNVTTNGSCLTKARTHAHTENSWYKQSAMWQQKLVELLLIFKCFVLRKKSHNLTEYNTANISYYLFELSQSNLNVSKTE